MPRWADAAHFRGAGAITSAFRGVAELAGGAAAPVGDPAGVLQPGEATQYSHYAAMVALRMTGADLTVRSLHAASNIDSAREVQMFILDDARTLFLGQTPWVNAGGEFVKKAALEDPVQLVDGQGFWLGARFRSADTGSQTTGVPRFLSGSPNLYGAVVLDPAIMLLRVGLSRDGLRFNTGSDILSTSYANSYTDEVEIVGHMAMWPTVEV